MIRKRIFEIIEVGKEGDKASNLYDVFMMLCIVVSLVPLCTKSTAQWTIIVDMATVAVFIIDYLLRLFTADLKIGKGAKSFIVYPVTPMAIIDILSILPSFGVLGQGAKVAKVFRLFKTLKVLKTLKGLKAFKVLKFVRYSNSITIILNVIKNQKESLLTVGGLALGYILIAALLVFNVEPDTFGNFFEAIYWASVSLTTVGYGDIYPISTAGRIVTMLSSFVGIAIVALPSGIITAGYMDEVQQAKKSEKEEEK